ncbi:MAG: hypothetical protein ABSD53_25295 [Terriglobales bacterium]
MTKRLRRYYGTHDLHFITGRVPHTSRTLRCVGFVTIQMCVDHRDAPTLGIILTA